MDLEAALAHARQHGARDRLRAPVPDWLADALITRAGQERLAVAAMDAATAFDAWNQFAVPSNEGSGTP